MRNSLLFGVGGLILGAIIGFYAANSINRSSVIAGGQDPLTAAGIPNSNSAAMGDVTETLDRADNEPQNFAAQMMAGDMFARIGNFDRAIEYYTRGLSLQPDDPAGNLVIANAYFDSGKFEQAGEHYAKVLAADPENIAARSDLATTFVQRPQPDHARAIAEFNKVLESDPNHEPTLYNLAIAHHRKGDINAAQDMAARLEKAHPQSPLTDKLRQNMEAK